MTSPRRAVFLSVLLLAPVPFAAFAGRADATSAAAPARTWEQQGSATAAAAAAAAVSSAARPG
ncbi:MAG TPA: hypothetical protein VK614_10425 [Allosphingosinicella sp.]|nr:hypothetical protein [Allosphingosinicella sp.]